MLEMIKGCYVPKAEQLCEQYEIKENHITANVNAGKIEEVFQHFICIQTAALFFILEIPMNEIEENKLRKSDTDPMHMEVYYIDGLDKETALVLLMRYSYLLINDGISRFGFGVQDNSAEIMLDKYNIMTVWSDGSSDYSDFFKAHDIPQTDKCVTAWDTFSYESAGVSEQIKVNGKTVYDLPDELKELGIYCAEIREE